MVSDQNNEGGGLSPEMLRLVQQAIGELSARQGVAPPVPNVAPEIYIGPGSTLRDWARGGA